MDSSKNATAQKQPARKMTNRKKFSFLRYVFRNKKKSATIFAACLFVLVFILYQAKALGWVDNSIHDFVTNARPTEGDAFLTVFFKNMTAYLNPYVLALGLFVIAAFGPGNHPAFSGFLNIAAIFIINEIIKVLVERPRPTGTRLVVETGYSFPSGHSVLAMAFFGFIIWLIWYSMRDRTFWRWCLTVLFSAIIVLVGMSRVYLGVHYTSDVIAGWCLGFVWVSFFTSVCAPRLMEAPRILASTELSGSGAGGAAGTGASVAERQSFGDSIEWRKQKKILKKLGVSAEEVAKKRSEARVPVTQAVQSPQSARVSQSTQAIQNPRNQQNPQNPRNQWNPQNQQNQQPTENA